MFHLREILLMSSFKGTCTHLFEWVSLHSCSRYFLMSWISDSASYCSACLLRWQFTQTVPIVCSIQNYIWTLLSWNFFFFQVKQITKLLKMQLLLLNLVEPKITKIKITTNTLGNQIWSLKISALQNFTWTFQLLASYSKIDSLISYYCNAQIKWEVRSVDRANTFY